MRKLLLLHLLFLFCSSSFCQGSRHTVRFVVQPPEGFKDKIYLAGSFNDWIPSDNNYLLQPLDGKRLFIDVNVPPGHYEYKFTRGNWSTVEVASSGVDISNRMIDLRRDTTVNIVIEGWLDAFKDISKLPDSTQWQVAYSRSFFYLDKNLDSSFKYAQQANAMLKQLDDKKYDAAMGRIFGRIMQHQGHYQKALEYYLKQLSLTQEQKDTLSMAFCLLDIGHLFFEVRDYGNAKNYYLQVMSFDPYKTASFGRSAPNLAYVGMGRVYYNTHQLDSARFYALKAYDFSLKYTDRPGQTEALSLLGNILEEEKRIGEAIQYYQLAILQGELYSSTSVIAENYYYIARAFYADKEVDSSLYYARKTFGLATDLKNPLMLMDDGNLLATIFKNMGRTDSAFHYLQIVATTKDSVFNQNKNQQLQTILFNEQLQQQEHKAENERFKSQVKVYIMTASIILLLVLVMFLWWNNQRKRNIDLLLKEKDEKLQKTVTELKIARSQLAQKEKKASLGELAANTADDMKSALNFINNASEKSVGLAKELKQELNTHDMPSDEKANLNSIADNLLEQEQKIQEQSRRADAVAKDMLTHSKAIWGEDSLLI